MPLGDRHSIGSGTYLLGFLPTVPPIVEPAAIDLDLRKYELLRRNVFADVAYSMADCRFPNSDVIGY